MIAAYRLYVRERQQYEIVSESLAFILTRPFSGITVYRVYVFVSYLHYGTILYPRAFPLGGRFYFEGVRFILFSLKTSSIPILTRKDFRCGADPVLKGHWCNCCVYTASLYLVK